MFYTLNSAALSAALSAILVVAGPATASDSFVDKSPLRADERQRVTAIALGARDRTRSLDNSPLGSAGARELLLVERRPDKSSGVRRADVYIYDYASDRLEHQIINVDDGEVIHSASLVDVQIPLTQREINRASAIVFSETSSRAQLDAEFRRVTGSPLDSVEQIHFKAFTFVVDAGRRPELAPSLHGCGRSRCAQILMYTADRVVLDLSPVVDLSTGAVLTVVSNGAGMDGERR